MQRVSAFLPSWDKRTSSSGAAANHNSNPGSKSVGGGGFFGWSNRSSTSSTRASVLNGLTKINVNTTTNNNRSSNAGSIANGRVQREAFWPATLDVECDKAARIVKSFSADGFLANLDDPTTTPSDEPKTPIKVPKKIPKRVIQNAAGIAVFTCMRSGLWMTGSGGSGILIARKSDGTWSPPSGIMLHTPTLSFIIGVDVYDCVLVVNSLSALESITQPRVTLGEDVGLTSGPLLPLDSSDTEMDINLKELGNTVFTYMKARGQEQVVNMNGCILTERANENERFYESSVTQMDVLSGNVSRRVDETQPLAEIIKLAEGRTDFDPAVIAKIAAEPAPGDANIASPNSTPHSPPRAFGIPQADDPDPFGVLALEMAGMEIREAGSRLRPASSQLDFHTRPGSSALSKRYRQSGDTFLTKSNRESCMSSRTVKSQMTDAYTQTDTGNTPETSPSPSRSEEGQEQASFEKMPERGQHEQEEEDEIDYTTVDLTPLKHLSHPQPSQESLAADTQKTTVTRDHTRLVPPIASEETDRRSKASSHYGEDDDGEVSNDDADDEDDEEEPVVFEVAAVQQTSTQAVASRMIHARGNMVTIPKRIPPPLPARNPARASMTNKSDMSGDASSLRSSIHRKPSDSGLVEELDDEKNDSTVALAEGLVADKSHSPSLPAESLKADSPELRSTELEAPRAQVLELAEAEADPSKDSEVHFEDNTEEPRSAIDELEFKVEENKGEELNSSEPKVEESRTEEPKAREPEAVDSEVGESKDEAALAVTPAEELDDSLDSHKKARLSIDTGATDARSSFDQSSYTTPPTSERHFALEDDGDETPKKSVKDAEQPVVSGETREVEGKQDTATATDAPASNGAIVA